MDRFSFEAIGQVRCDGRYKFEAPRQGVFSSARAVIELNPEFAGDAVKDLADFDRIWVIFVFDRNIHASWKAHVSPPYTPENRKYSLFATRSPYRPNPIGMSCVKLDRIENGRRLFISEHDLLDGTPIFDIKPYLAYVDSHPEASNGFALDEKSGSIEVEISENLLLTIPENKRKALIAVLAQDPRPGYQDDNERIYGIEFAGFDVRFTVSGNKLKVIEIKEKRS